MPLSSVDRQFINPSEPLEYSGPFTIEVEDPAKIRRVVPPWAPLEGSLIRKTGYIKEDPVIRHTLRIRPYLGSFASFYLPFDTIICIRKEDGSLLWRNYNL